MSDYDPFFAELEADAPEEWTPLYEQAPNLRKFVDGTAPRAKQSPYFGCQIRIRNSHVESSFVIYEPHRRNLVRAFKNVGLRYLPDLEAEYGSPLRLGVVETETGADLSDVVAWSSSDRDLPALVEWTVSSQTRLRHAVHATGFIELVRPFQ